MRKSIDDLDDYKEDFITEIIYFNKYEYFYLSFLLEDNTVHGDVYMKFKKEKCPIYNTNTVKLYLFGEKSKVARLSKDIKGRTSYCYEFIKEYKKRYCANSISD